MRQILGVGASLLALSCGLQAATLIHNVNGYTMDKGELKRFHAMEYHEGKITHIYASKTHSDQSTADTRIDGKQATLLPGLIDAHGHVLGHGMALTQVRLEGAQSQKEAIKRIQSYLKTAPDLDWIRGRGWNQVLWPDKQFPTKNTLDKVVSDKPVALGRVDGHALWVNSKALKLAGITKATKDPDGGQIIRDQNGEPTGVLIDNAMAMVYDVIPKLTQKQMQHVLKRSMQDLARYGLTSVHDAGISAQNAKAYEALNQQREMPIRIYAMLSVLDPANDSYLQKGPVVDAEQMLAIRSVKISADGALGSRGAALHQDYSDKPGHKGLMLFGPKELNYHIKRAMEAGYQVNTHAIGDHANTRVLDYYAPLMMKTGTQKLRHRIEHAQVMTLEDIKRMAKMDVIASMQPTHATSDKNMAGDRLGEQRLDGAYAWRKVLDAGAIIAGGSDFPVEHANPMYGLHAAITRQDHHNQPQGGWRAEEKLSREEALTSFTESAAYAAHQEKTLGSLKPGYWADFILLDKDYFQQDEKTIWQNQVLATYVAGEPVYQF